MFSSRDTNEACAVTVSVVCRSWNDNLKRNALCGSLENADAGRSLPFVRQQMAQEEQELLAQQQQQRYITQARLHAGAATALY